MILFRKLCEAMKAISSRFLSKALRCESAQVVRF